MDLGEAVGATLRDGLGAGGGVGVAAGLFDMGHAERRVGLAAGAGGPEGGRTWRKPPPERMFVRQAVGAD
ncbi:MAG: hypothetical protein ACK4TJ_09610 [Tabrizicola sp.]